MNRPGFFLALARAAVLSIVASLVIVPLIATFLGGFKSVGELRASPFGLPPVWRIETYTDILGGTGLLGLYPELADHLVFGGVSHPDASLDGSLYLRADPLFRLEIYPGLSAAGADVPVCHGDRAALLQIRNFGLLDNPLGVILPQTAFSMAFAIVLLRSFFQQLPKELFEAAYVDG